MKFFNELYIHRYDLKVPLSGNTYAIRKYALLCMQIVSSWYFQKRTVKKIESKIKQQWKAALILGTRAIPFTISNIGQMPNE